MNHAGHVVGGLLTGGAVCFLASTTGDVQIDWEIKVKWGNNHYLLLRTLRLF